MFKIFITILMGIAAMTASAGSLEVNGYQDPGGRLTAHYIDLDSACTFIELPNGETMLVNSCGDKTADYIEKQGYAYIDYIIITAADKEHIEGLDEVIKRFGVSKVYMPAELNKSSQDLVDTLKENGLVAAFSSGDTEIKKTYDLKVEIFAPEEDSLSDTYTTLKITYGNTTLVFAGEQYAASQQTFWNVFE